MAESKHKFTALGTQFTFKVFGEQDDGRVKKLFIDAEKLVHVFDDVYSRFKDTSIVSKIRNKTGVIDVPTDFVEMLKIYEKFYTATNGAISPLIGEYLESIGYDKNYSFNENDAKPQIPPLKDTIKILSDTQILKNAPCLFDFGALGKGYIVDIVANYFIDKGFGDFVIDGSGDTFVNTKLPYACGLENPFDKNSIIGVSTLTNGSLCASALNRRSWGSRNHYVNGKTTEHPEYIIATFAYHKETTISDALTSALFFVDGDTLKHNLNIQFEYLVINNEGKIKKSANFPAEIFS